MRDIHLPCVTVFSDFTNPEIIVKKILDCEDLPEALPLEAATKGYPWLIDTKYYKAHVNICPIQHGEKLPDTILELTEGLILYFDSKNITSFNKVKKWVDDTNICPEVLLLVCDTFKDIPSGGVNRTTAMEWCLDNGYELVELHSEEVVENNDYDIIPEKRGYERIVEALHTHTWSNMDVKSNNQLPKTKCQNKPSANADVLLDEDTEEFCELFSQLQGMKESLQSLPARERRACAEQVVATFWKAIGGDENEIGDVLNDDSD